MAPEKGSLYEFIRDKVVDSAVKAVVWAIAGVVLWALYTAYSLDSKMERNDRDLRTEMIDHYNDLINENADLWKYIMELEEKMNARAVPPQLPPPPGQPPGDVPLAPGSQIPQQSAPQYPGQHPIDYIQQHRKRYVPEGK